MPAAVEQLSDRERWSSQDSRDSLLDDYLLEGLRSVGLYAAKAEAQGENAVAYRSCIPIYIRGNAP